MRQAGLAAERRVPEGRKGRYFWLVILGLLFEPRIGGLFWRIEAEVIIKARVHLRHFERAIRLGLR
jgi:hypothetical protein